MPDSTLPYSFWMWPLTVVGAGLGAYFGAYLKKKGEDRATQEALTDLVRQVEATTAATQAIEAKFSNQVWDRQRQWEMKKEVLFEVSGRMGELDDTLLSHYTVLDA